MENELAAFGMTIIIISGFFILYAYVTGNVPQNNVTRYNQSHIDAEQIKSSTKHKHKQRTENIYNNKYDLKD